MLEERAVKPSIGSLPVLLVERFTDINEPDADPAPVCSREIICAIDAYQPAEGLGAVIGVIRALQALDASGIYPDLPDNAAAGWQLCSTDFNFGSVSRPAPMFSAGGFSFAALSMPDGEQASAWFFIADLVAGPSCAFCSSAVQERGE